MVGRAFAALVVVVALPAVLLPMEAGADPVGSTEAAVQTLESKVTAQASVIHGLTTAYQDAALQSTTLSEQITADRTSLSVLRSKVAITRSSLRQAAIRSYTDGAGPSATDRDSSNPAIGDEYLTVASGDVDDTIDQLNAEQSELGSAEANLRQEQRANAIAVAAAAGARNQALAAAAAEQTQLDTLQAHLEQLQAAAAQAAAQATLNARAADNARAAAAALAAAHATTQGAPVDGGLVSLVKSELNPASIDSTSSVEPDPVAAAPATTSPPSSVETPSTAAPSGSAETSVVPTTITPVTSEPPTTAVPTTAVPTPTAPTAGPVAGSISADLAGIRQCESGGNYGADTGNGYYGAYQFSAATWTGLGFTGTANQASAAQQDQAASELEARGGWAEWPTCAAALGL